LNTGHEGGAGTVHANSTREVPARLEALAALGGMSPATLLSQLAAAVQVVLHVIRTGSGARRLGAVAVLGRVDGGLAAHPVWEHGRGWGTGRATLDALLRERGVEPPC
ncbi:MAG: pilus assembly protein CpaF, partial [Pseudonocardiales bacterium]|nr:pilus assembly protein CpaF [Pseudonocardiales bacterium]